MGENNSAGEQGQGPIAHRLDHLIRTLHPKDRGPYTYQEIADSIREQAGPDDPTVSHGTIHSLHKGKVTNPSVDTLRALGKFFGVGAKYFLDDEVAARTDARIRELREGADRAEAGRELADALEDKQVKAVAFRLRGLSAAALRGITSIVDGARQAEGLPRVDRTPDRTSAGTSDRMPDRAPDRTPDRAPALRTPGPRTPHQPPTRLPDAGHDTAPRP